MKTDPPKTDENSNRLPCSCMSLKDDEIVMCSGQNCVIRSYHKSCTGRKRFNQNWLCVLCQREQAKKRRADASSKRAAPQ